GFRTCLLANTWVDDTSWRRLRGALLARLGRHFQPVLESCRVGMRKPDPGIYSYALEELRARPHEV
ncbi:HYES hydrolase, partial [Chloropsis hardwickii]|nr:HYES hydrolase [Chloropsis hardwickii]